MSAAATLPKSSVRVVIEPAPANARLPRLMPVRVETPFQYSFLLPDGSVHRATGTVAEVLAYWRLLKAEHGEAVALLSGAQPDGRGEGRGARGEER